jgi:hypothetical protein
MKTGNIANAIKEIANYSTSTRQRTDETDVFDSDFIRFAYETYS